MWTILDSDNNTQATTVPELDEALELIPAPAHKRSVLTGLAYLLTSLVLIAVLAAQYLAYHFQTLSQNPTLRPWLNSICQQGICALPPLTDISQIRSEELLLRSHPDLDDMLIMQMNFRNLADFSQPLPAFDLMFTDIRGTTVAGRRFQPQDYLGLSGADQPGSSSSVDPSAADLITVPAGALVMASLTFTDPGVDAVNYQVTFTTSDQVKNLLRNRTF